jgi:hypothetical protein
MNIEHYNTVNGRLIVHIIDQIILFINKNLFIVINPLLLLSFAFFASKCFNSHDTDNKENTYTSFAFILFFIMSLPKEIINESVYWITGSMNYTLPALLLVIMYYYLKSNIINQKNTVFMIIICILAGATTEQGGFLAFVLASLLVLCHDAEKWRIYHFAPLFTMAGFLTVILAPGTLMRISYSRAEGLNLDALYYMITTNISVLSTYITGASGINLILILLIFTLSFITYKDKKVNRLFFFGFVIAAFMIYQRLFNLYSVKSCMVSAGLSSAYIILWSISVLKHRQYRDAAIFIIGAVFLQAFMLVSPVIGTRTVLISALLLSATVGFLCISLIKSRFYATIFVCASAIALLPLNMAAAISAISIILFFKKEWIKFQLPVLLAVLLLFFIPIANGYYSNYKILKINEKNIPIAQASGKLFWNIDLIEPYRHKMFYENSDFEPYFLMDNGLPADTQLYLVSKIHKPIFFNNNRLKSPSIMDNVRYYPLRDVFEAAGADVVWDNISMSINVFLNDTTYILKDDFTVTKIQNDKQEIIRLDSKKQTILCRTYIPESFLAALFDITEKNDNVFIDFKK